MYKILDGVRIVDLTTVVLGPYATKVLADLGADVVKIEPLSGDQFRSVRPGHSDDLGAGFINLNINKRSIALNLATAEGREILQRLVKSCDVIVHNMRPKSAEKFDISYEKLKKIKSDIIYCYAPGYGQNGKHADKPAYDDIIQAASGIAHLNASATGEPRFLPTIVGDKVAGLYLALSIIAGIANHARTGNGCCIETPMFESVVSFLLVEQLAGQSFVPALGGMGYDRLTSPNRKPFATSDGFVSILPYSTTHWRRYLNAIDRNDIAQLDWVTDPVKRSQNIDTLYQIIDEVTPTRSTNAWCELLQELDIPCTPVNKPDDLLSDPHLAGVQMFREYEHPTEGRMRSVRTPMRVIESEETVDMPAPNIGRDTRTILIEAGYSNDEINILAEREIIRIGQLSDNFQTSV